VDAAIAVNSLVGSVVEERYLVEAELGAGAMGTVYRGRHIKVGRAVAIKVLHDELVQEPSMVERFEREALIAARLTHANLTSVLDIGVTPQGQRCMILELAPGRSLAALVGRPLPRERVVDVVRQLLLGLEHAHELGLVHRDLKPDNILVEEHADGRWTPRIVDFGIATLRDSDERDGTGPRRRLTTTGMVLGTPMYMSPEQAQGEGVDHRADLFALGVIMYELLAGVPPFEGTGMELILQSLVHDPPSIATRAGVDVDAELEAFARRLMARSAGDRFTSAADALAHLERIERAVGDRPRSRDHIVTVSMPALSRGDSPPRRPLSGRWERWGALAGAAAIVGVALLLVVAWAVASA